MKYRIPLAYDQFDEKEIDSVSQILAVGRYTQGEQVSLFEKEFATYLGVEYAVMMNSGSSANLIATTATWYAGLWDEALTFGRLRAGDEVVIPALCWPTTLTALGNLGLRPAFCDIDLESMNLSVGTVERVRTNRTRAVIAVPILGNPSGISELREYCRAERLVLLEDACESLGAFASDGKKIGSFGLTASFSFYFSHHITTIEGGCVVTDSPLVVDLCRALRAHGWTRQITSPELVKSFPESDQIDDRFCFFLPGYNVRATEIAAALGRVQLAKFPEFLARRRNTARERLHCLEPFQEQVTVPGARVGDGHSWMTFPLLLNSSRQRDRLRAGLEERGIETRPIVAGNILRHPMARFFELGEKRADLDACDAVFQRGLMMGMNPNSSDEDEAYLKDALEDCFKHIGV